MSGSLWVAVGVASLATVIAFVHLPKHQRVHGPHAVPTNATHDAGALPELASHA